jgi:hypothetical protein
LTEILRSTTQDPTPLLSLTVKLLAPLSFSRTLTIADAPSILTALQSPLPGANLLALAILHKAARSPADAAILSTLPELFSELVRRWLDASDVGVGERAARVLGDLLEVDCPAVKDQPHDLAQINGTTSTDLVQRSSPGHGRLWRLLFTNQQIFTIIPQLCGSPTAGSDSDEPRTERELSISQGRLLRILPRLATLDIKSVSQTQFPELLPLAGSTNHGLLQWAALGMVDMADMLMHLSVIDFVETFVSVMRIAVKGDERQEIVKGLVKEAVNGDTELRDALAGLADRTAEEEAEPLRRYISQLLS